MGKTNPDRKKRKRKKDRYSGKTHRNNKIKKSKKVTTKPNIKDKSKHARINRLDKIDSDYFPSGFKTTVLHKDPYIVKLRRFLNSEEIETLLSMAQGKFEKSTIVVDGEMVLSNVRTSETAYITECGHPDRQPKPVRRLLDKVCYLTGCEKHQIEGLMVVKYGEGDEYYNHHDYFKPEHTEVLSNGGQRIAIFFCYLNSLDVGNGGETEFPLIGVKSKPSRGTAIFWWDTSKNGELLTKTLHRGNPVKSGVKYGLNIWVRATGWK
jgi:prolyl 4-hydroxylase